MSKTKVKIEWGFMLPDGRVIDCFDKEYAVAFAVNREGIVVSRTKTISYSEWT